MSGHISPVNFDPHKDAIDGPPVDLWPRDYRLDEGVRVARRMNWLVGDDPAPEYSDWDARDGLMADVVLPTVDDSHNPPSSPVRVVRGFERVTPEPVEHSMYGPMKVALVLVAGFVVAFALVILGWVLKGTGA